MELEAIALVVAAVVGSTGLASLITAGLQLSRASRIKKAARDMSFVMELTEQGTTEHDAAGYALKVLTLDLVAVRLVRVGAGMWWNTFSVVVVVSIPAVVYLSLPKEVVPVVLSEMELLRTILLVAASYTLVLVGSFVFLFSRKRERLVANVLEEDKFYVDYVLMQSPPLQTQKYRAEMKVLMKDARRAARTRTQGQSNGETLESGRGSVAASDR